MSTTVNTSKLRTNISIDGKLFFMEFCGAWVIKIMTKRVLAFVKIFNFRQSRNFSVSGFVNLESASISDSRINTVTLMHQVDPVYSTRSTLAVSSFGPMFHNTMIYIFISLWRAYVVCFLLLFSWVHLFSVRICFPIDVICFLVCPEIFWSFSRSSLAWKFRCFDKSCKEFHHITKHNKVQWTFEDVQNIVFVP